MVGTKCGLVNSCIFKVVCDMQITLGIVESFLEKLTVSDGLSQNTTLAYKRDVLDFQKFIEAKKLKPSPEAIRHYLVSLSEKSLSERTQARRLSALKHFFKFALERDIIDHDPTQGVEMPKLPKTLPKALSTQEMEALLTLDRESATPDALRQRAIIEVLYSTGIRVTELATLKMGDLEADPNPTLRVTGKGDKQRLVPLSVKAYKTVKTYMDKARPKFDGTAQSKWLFPSRQGRPLTRQRLFQIVRKAGERCGIDLSPHQLRHTFATYLLENDADLRAVQMMLGHSDLSTTQVYTQVVEDRLRDVIEEKHPLQMKSNGTTK